MRSEAPFDASAIVVPETMAGVPPAVRTSPLLSVMAVAAVGDGTEGRA